MDIALLKDKSNIVNFTKGQIIIEDGETMCDNMYIILKGTADIYKNYQDLDELKIASLVSGDFFGEMSLFLNKERSATVVAGTDVIALSIDRFNAYEFFEKQPEMTYSMIKTLCSRIDTTNAAYRKLHSETHPEAYKGDEFLFPSLSWLFPSKHKKYRRKIDMARVNELEEANYKCPVCGKAFKAKASLLSILETMHTYRRPSGGSNSFYFEVVTCPTCWYSAFANIFEKPSKSSKSLFDANIASSKDDMATVLGEKGGISGVFARYLLAAKCAPHFFERGEEITGRLWTRLSWLYSDCKDAEFEAYAAAMARDAYILSTQKREVAKDQLAITYINIGDLSLKADDLQTAKAYFLRAEECPGRPEIKQMATERWEQVQVLLSQRTNLLRTKSAGSE